MKFRNLLFACLMGLTMLGAAGVASAEDVRMFVRHEVADYGAWRKTYDAFAPTQKRLGVIYEAVYQSTDDPSRRDCYSRFSQCGKGQAFAASAELKAAMESGVKGACHRLNYTTKSQRAK